MLSFVWKYLTMFIFVIKIEIKIYFFGTPTFDTVKLNKKAQICLQIICYVLF